MSDWSILLCCLGWLFKHLYPLVRVRVRVVVVLSCAPSWRKQRTRALARADSRACQAEGSSWDRACWRGPRACSTCRRSRWGTTSIRWRHWAWSRHLWPRAFSAPTRDAPIGCACSRRTIAAVRWIRPMWSFVVFRLVWFQNFVHNIKVQGVYFVLKRF